jgi:hypothetical protein
VAIIDKEFFSAGFPGALDRGVHIGRHPVTRYFVLG